MMSSDLIRLKLLFLDNFIRAWLVILISLLISLYLCVFRCFFVFSTNNVNVEDIEQHEERKRHIVRCVRDNW